MRPRLLRARPDGQPAPPPRTRRPDPATLSEDEREDLAERLRERVYVTFAALAVILTLQAHAHGLSAGTAAASLAITAVGTVAAAWLAVLAVGVVALKLLAHG